MSEITVPSSLIAIQTKEPMSPAMRAAIWEIGAALDAARIKPGQSDAVWLTIPTARLRGEGSKTDNQHLKTTLERLTGIYLSGEHKGDEWGAVILAQWHFEQGGSMARLLVPPAAVEAIQSPKTFAKIESRAAHSLSGHGRQLYVLLADKKRMRQTYWQYTLDELRALMGCEEKKAYQVWAQFNKRVLQPALAEINDFGTVSVKMTPKRLGRAVHWVRFDWAWKDPHEAAATALENDRHTEARRKEQATQDAPPMIEDEPESDPAREWWLKQSDSEKKALTDWLGPYEIDGLGDTTISGTRPEKEIIRMAYDMHINDEL